MSRTSPPPQEYNVNYFFDEYKKQYGKTYLEDFPAIKENGARRLALIRHVLTCRPGKAGISGKPRLLDIGCAYGAFLEAACEANFAPEGIDPAPDAVRHVREKLGLTAVCGSFPEDTGDIIRNTYNVITLWYVIEHFPDFGAALEAANGLLEDGGVLAFSTPSFGGISRRKSLRNFLENSPEDHWTVWDPGRCAKILSKFGFRLRKLVSTGHHPERFPRPLSFLPRGFLLLLSRIFALGDTFEAYAVKTDLPCVSISRPAFADGSKALHEGGRHE
jgi:2-polyprenyl-3-methyl-5-hydroxy-6-metoxy-1,4-benzoquinol methylase